MSKSLTASLVGLAMSSLFFAGSAQATPASIPDCNKSDAKVTSISVAGGATVNTSTYNSAECVGAYAGNAIPIPQTNLGYLGDGLFNGAPAGGNGNANFPNGIFSDQYTATDLNHDGQADPGWIRLGTWTPGTGFEVASIGGTTGIVLSTWFTVTGAGSSGTWSFTPDADLASRISPTLGISLFDQFALSFMAGDRFAAYDFTADEFGMPISPTTIFNFSGTWDMSKTLINNGGNAAALSHIDLYVRDPIGAVPEPASLALLGLGLAGLGFTHRKKHEDP